jgi:hypothetical protein
MCIFWHKSTFMFCSSANCTPSQASSRPSETLTNGVGLQSCCSGSWYGCGMFHLTRRESDHTHFFRQQSFFILWTWLPALVSRIPAACDEQWFLHDCRWLFGKIPSASKWLYDAAQCQGERSKIIGKELSKSTKRRERYEQDCCQH